MEIRQCICLGFDPNALCSYCQLYYSVNKEYPALKGVAWNLIKYTFCPFRLIAPIAVIWFEQHFVR